MIGSGVEKLDQLIGGGYPVPGSILVAGPPSIEKEVLALQFILTGLDAGEPCFILTTTRSKNDLVETIKLLNPKKGLAGALYFMDASGEAAGSTTVDLGKLEQVYATLKDFLESNSGSTVRGYIELLSPALLINPPERVYEFALRLNRLIHQYKATVLMLLEEQMHDEKSVAALKQTADGVISMKLETKGYEVANLLTVEKMGGRIFPKKYYAFNVVMPESEKALKL